MQALVEIEPGTAKEFVTEEIVLAIALTQSVQQSGELNRLIARAVKAYNPDSSEPYEAVIAEGTKPEMGCNGEFHLEPELEQIYEQIQARESEQTETPESTDQEPQDHHNRTMLMIVKPGQRLGSLTPPTDGVDGVDVSGKTLSTKPGKPAIEEFDSESIECRDDHSVVAKIGGQLIIQQGKVGINPTLEIKGNVDFSTGNIDFPGTIEISEGVRDCFVVQSGESISVAGLVEAATLKAGKDLVLKRGMAARDKGLAEAGRDLKANYLDNVTGQAGRDLLVDKEITNSRISVGRQTIAPSATIIGGELICAGSCELGQIGTEAGAHTIIAMGRIESVEGLIKEALELIPTLNQRAAHATDQLEQVKSSSPVLSAKQAEIVTELQYKAMQAQAKIKPLRRALTLANEIITNSTEMALVVHTMLCQGAEIRAGGKRARISTNIKGPVRVSLTDGGEFQLTDLNTNSVMALDQFAAIDDDPTAFDRKALNAELKPAA